MQNHPELSWKPPAVKATLWHKTTPEQPNVIASSRPAGQLNNRASPLVSDRPNDPTPKRILRNECAERLRVTLVSCYDY